MAISRVHTWSAGEVLLASDLNAEFNSILNNGSDLVSPFTKAISMGSFALNFDAANTIALTSTTSGINLTGGTLREPAEDSLTAFATGGQTNASAISLAKKYHRIATCATAADSVKLPASTLGQAHFIRNDGAASAQVFGTSPDTINGVATGTGIALPAGAGAWFVCCTAGNWVTSAILSSVLTLPASGTLATLAGSETLSNKTLTNPASTTQALTDAATTAWDASLGSTATLLATSAVGNTRAIGAPSNLKTGGRYVLHYTQDATGGRALTFNAVFAGFSGGAVPACNTVGAGVTVFVFESPDGTNLRLVAYSQPRDGPIASGRNIAARTNSGTPNTKLDITADQIVLQDTNGNSYTASTVSVTINFGTTGANGIDSGSQASSTWNYGWIIAKPDGTVAGLGSTSASAPTMPSGYTFKALVTAAFSDGSTHFLPYRQFGNRVYYESQQSALSNGTSTVEAAVSLTALVPPSATEILLNTQHDALCDGSGNFNDIVGIRVVSGSTYWSQQNVHSAESPNAAIFCGTSQLAVPNISQNLYYLHTTGAGATFHFSIWVCGFTLPGGGE